MDEEQFWQTTPRKLSILSKVHVEVNNPSDKQNTPEDSNIDPRLPKAKAGFIDQVL